MEPEDLEDIEQVEDGVEQGEAPEITPELEQAREEARKYGWRKKEEFDRPPENWVDADRYMELPQTRLKMQRDETRELKDSMARLEAMQKSIVERTREQERAAANKRIAELKAQQRAAVEDGDVEQFDKISKAVEQVKVPTEAPQLDPVVSKYMAENEWTNDPEMAGFAYEVIDKTPGALALSVERQMKLAEQKVREAFPDRFETAEKPAPRAARVDGGGLNLGRKAEKGASDLPADVARIGKEYVEDGVYKTLEEYAADYWAQEV